MFSNGVLLLWQWVGIAWKEGGGGVGLGGGYVVSELGSLGMTGIGSLR